MKVTQTAIARRVGMDVSSVNKILNRRGGAVFRKDTIRKVVKAARELGYDFERLKFHHRRRHPRKEVSIDADIAVVLEDGAVFDEGAATIRDLSQGGARITDVTLSRGKIPVSPFSVRLRPRVKPLEDLELSGRIVRFDPAAPFGFGVAFGELNPGVLRKLRRFTSAS